MSLLSQNGHVPPPPKEKTSPKFVAQHGPELGYFNEPILFFFLTDFKTFGNEYYSQRAYCLGLFKIVQGLWDWKLVTERRAKYKGTKKLDNLLHSLFMTYNVPPTHTHTHTPCLLQNWTKKKKNFSKNEFPSFILLVEL